MELGEYPLIELPGSEGWRTQTERGRVLEALFPDQDAMDLSYAWGLAGDPPGIPADTDRVKYRLGGVLMLHQGWNDGDHWLWLVTFTVTNAVRTWPHRHLLLYGGCDYTGWDCQAGAEWINADWITLL